MRRELLAGLALSLAPVACSAPESADPVSGVPGANTLPGSDGAFMPTTETMPPLVFHNEYADLMQADAPIQIVYIPTSADLELGLNFWSDVTREKFFDTQGDGRAKVLGAALTKIVSATSGFYTPSDITVVETAGMPEIECIDLENTLQVLRIDNYAAEFSDPKMINVVLIDADPCEDSAINSFSGYSFDGLAPVVAANGIDRLGQVMIHEIGHTVGLEHAGSLVCKDSVAVKECVSDKTGDITSTMGYGGEARVFSIPEMLALGLIDENRILTNPVNGIYTLTDVKNEQATPALIELDTEAGKMYFSWQNDEQASFDIFCMTETSGTSPENAELYTLINTDEGGQIACFKGNLRYQDHSLQVRVADIDGSYDLVGRADRMPDDPSVDPIVAGKILNNTFTHGEVLAGTVLYEDKKLRVTFVGTDELNNAIVEIERLKA